ncbi:MAG TPA: alanine dehydrogenase [Vulgatibacter sp.]|nr:alanine dehydrogenase [Vulgatibacter sp.]
MIVGVPKEIKVREYRVGMVPGFVKALTSRGHQVLVQKGAGLGSAIPDADYVAAGAMMIETADEVWKRAEMIVKVKEPIAEEYERIQPGQTIYTFFHLAAVPALAKVLVEKKVTSVAYETIQIPNGSLPLLKPMSEVAGRLSVQVGAMSLFREKGGKGILLGGVPGVRRGRVTIIGGGTVGTNAAKMAVGLGAEVTILDTNIDRLAYLDDIFGGRVTTLFSNQHNIHLSVTQSDLVVGAVLIPGAAAPKLVTASMLEEMEDGSVVVDVAVDQGGCIETCVPTTHDNPTFIKHGVVHYCVANMPGAVAQTSTYALNNVTEPYGIKLAQLGVVEAVKCDPALALGVNTYGGAVTYEAVASSLGMPYTPLGDALAGGARN